MKNFKIILSSITIFLLINTLVFAQGDIEEEFRKRNGEEWVVGSYPWGYINLATRVRPEDVGPEITNEQALDIAEDFMSLNKDLFGIETLTFYDVKIKGYEEYRSWVVYFTGDVYEGLPVTEIDMRLLMTLDGQIFGVGDVEVCSKVFYEILLGRYPMPEISEDEAINSAQSSIGGGREPIEANLKYVPSSEKEDFEYMLAWELSFGNKKVILDAMNGSVVSTKTIEPNTQKKGDTELIKTSIFLIICIIVVVSIGIFLLKKQKVSILHESKNVHKNKI